MERTHLGLVEHRGRGPVYPIMDAALNKDAKFVRGREREGIRDDPRLLGCKRTIPEGLGRGLQRCGIAVQGATAA